MKNYKIHFLCRGLTLLELLIVIALLAVIAALLFFGYQRITSAAMGTQNVLNHRTLASALIAYAQENNGNLPYSYRDRGPWPDFPNQRTTYTRELAYFGYLENPEKTIIGPHHRGWDGSTYETSTGLREPHRDVVVPWWYTNYGASRRGAMPYSADSPRRPANLLQVAADGNLSKLMLLRDVYRPRHANRGGGSIFFSGAGYFPPEEFTYGGMVHASYADGHVRAFPREELRELLENARDGEEPEFRNTYIRP